MDDLCMSLRMVNLSRDHVHKVMDLSRDHVHKVMNLSRDHVHKVMDLSKDHLHETVNLRRDCPHQSNTVITILLHLFLRDITDHHPQDVDHKDLPKAHQPSNLEFNDRVESKSRASSKMLLILLSVALLALSSVQGSVSESSSEESLRTVLGGIRGHLQKVVSLNGDSLHRKVNLNRDNPHKQVNLNRDSPHKISLNGDNSHMKVNLNRNQPLKMISRCPLTLKQHRVSHSQSEAGGEEKGLPEHDAGGAGWRAQKAGRVAKAMQHSEKKPTLAPNTNIPLFLSNRSNNMGLFIQVSPLLDTQFWGGDFQGSARGHAGQLGDTLDHDVLSVLSVQLTDDLVEPVVICLDAHAVQDLFHVLEAGGGIAPAGCKQDPWGRPIRQ
ncbi:hypothetical protein Celaphus_00014005 [Cervus elaphus hippelaphus]|uniref:Uncharacterized protein n=1 Tax=Cervus elaphus hippelaphus TaxID=46360 RepID=A0A212CCB5_CEREH|nr:hypothetical protein Celaphus_00014005 [Cervus elaphus hippelaphus]